MALINCPECGKEVSSKAMACIHCGFPLSSNQESKCIIKATDYFGLGEFGPGMLEIGIYNSNGEEITSMRSGTSVSISIDSDVELYAQFKKHWWTATKGQDFHEKVRKKLESNKIKVLPNKITYLQITPVQATFLQTRLHISEVGIVDSE